MTNSEDLLTPEDRDRLGELSKTHLGFFRMEVLAPYRANSHKFEVYVSDFHGEVSGSDRDPEAPGEWEDQGSIRVRFGFRKLRSGEWAVAALKHDINEYSEGHLERWRPYLVDHKDLEPLPDVRFETWAARYIFGSWEVENNVIDRIEELVALMNALVIETLGTPLFDSPKNRHLVTPIAENDLAYQDAHRELYAYLLDGLNKDAVSALIALSGATATKNDKQTRKRLELALPGMSGSSLWATLDKVSHERGLAAHKVRPQAVAFKAFEAFVADLSDVQVGLSDLLSELSSLLDADPRKAMERQQAQNHLQKINEPMKNQHGMRGLDQTIGRTIERIEFGLRENIDSAHRSDVVLIYFTDGSVVGLDTGSNAGNISMDHPDVSPSDFDVYFISHFVPPPQKP